jgi:hypothetical protein
VMRHHLLGLQVRVACAGVRIGHPRQFTRANS